MKGRCPVWEHCDYRWPAYRRTLTRVATILVLLVVSTAYVVGSTNSPFLYFNF